MDIAQRRAFATVLTATVLALTALLAPPAHAVVCRTAPEQCEAILVELKKYPGVCESIPTAEDPEPYNWDERSLCDDPDGWWRYLVKGVVYRWCPEGRCVQLI